MPSHSSTVHIYSYEYTSNEETSRGWETAGEWSKSLSITATIRDEWTRSTINPCVFGSSFPSCHHIRKPIITPSISESQLSPSGLQTHRWYRVIGGRRSRFRTSRHRKLRGSLPANLMIFIAGGRTSGSWTSGAYTIFIRCLLCYSRIPVHIVALIYLAIDGVISRCWLFTTPYTPPETDKNDKTEGAQDEELRDIERAVESSWTKMHEDEFDKESIISYTSVV